ncbi:MAG: 2-amino-4-hydroxy-6-hydroxymethyldihydropteridine diphosphokinase [Sedimentisphaerales bacterium]|nr:2-amino-4-hydroxy-6-hydroxymethyldihydropteridine diphosphokinase [Sedimentisphaerales bacterium]
MNQAIIAVGANIAPEENIARAEDILKIEHTFLAGSDFVKTAPRGFPDQDDFLNGAFCIQTDMELEALRCYLKNVEARLGRIRTSNKNGPRTIDLDVVVFNGAIVDEDYYRYDFVKNAVEDIRTKIDKGL